MKTCKTCNGKGWMFVKGQVISGWDRFMGFELPRMTDGMVKSTCSKCYGQGKK
jgi:DnaJ-class molecular chaperone